MPTYEYRCTDCEHDFERQASVAEYEEGLDTACPECGSQQTTRRLGSIMISMGDGASDDAPQGGCCTPGAAVVD